MAEQSGARYGGDDYQHLYSWLITLDLLKSSNQQHAHVFIEHPTVQAVDDVTFHPEDPSRQVTKYYQIKWHATQSSSYTFEILIDDKEGPSLLLKFWKSWNILSANSSGPIELWLASNWPGSTENGEFGKVFDGMDDGLREEFLSSKKYAYWKKEWQSHLSTNDDEKFTKFIRALRFEFRFTSHSNLEEEINRRMHYYHLRDDLIENDFFQITGKFRKLIGKKGENKKITYAKLNELIKQLGLNPPPKYPILYVAGWNSIPEALPYTPDLTLDVSNYFKRNPNPDRVPLPEEWTGPIKEKFQNLDRQVKQKHIKNLKVEGQMPLTIAFALGTLLHRRAGCNLFIHTNEPDKHEFWDASENPQKIPKLQFTYEDGDQTSTNVCLCIGIHPKIKGSVKKYLASARLDIRSHIYVEVASDNLIKNAGQAIYIADQIMKNLLALPSREDITATHVFYAGPVTLAIMIGQRLNAKGHFQFYDYPHDLGTYVPAYTFQ